MSEKLNDILMFANQNPSSWLATTEGDQPRVRGMLMWFADETGFYYHTAKSKSISRELQKNPKVEAAFIRNANEPTFEMLRVTGTMEVVEDKELEKRLFQERAWLWNNIKQAGCDTDVVIMRIVKGSAYIWSMAVNLREDDIPRVNF